MFLFSFGNAQILFGAEVLLPTADMAIKKENKKTVVTDYCVSSWNKTTLLL